MTRALDSEQRGAAVLRRFGETVVVFDELTWQTHILPPAAAVVADICLEMPTSQGTTDDDLFAAVQAELGLDLDPIEIKELFRMFRKIGILPRVA